MPCRGVFAWIAGAAWAGVVLAGSLVVLRHDGEPGAMGTPTSGSVAGPRDGRPRLLMFVHPRCPCTRASLGELEKILVRGGDRLECTVFFFRPEGAPESWARTPLRRAAEAIPGVRAADDPGGREARRFGAVTSGHTVLLAADGSPAYSGGITGARGHAGDNAGAEAAARLVEVSRAPRTTHPVFGCTILDPGDAP